MDIRLLGPVEVWAGTHELDTGPPQRRVTLAALALDAGRPVLTETLIERIWGERSPAQPRAAVHAHIAMIRRLLEAAHAADAEQPPVTLVHRGNGYVLRADPQQVDLLRFRSLVGAARRRPDGERAALLGEALELWRGPALADLAGEWPARMRDGWGLERLDAAVDWARAALRLGHHAPTISRVRALLDDYPVAEPLAAVLMQALARAGRLSEVFDCYATLRQRLAEQFGVDPGPELQQLYQAALRGDLDEATAHRAPGQATPTGAADQAALPTAPRERAVPAQLPADVRGFSGRGDEIDQLDRILDAAEQQVTSVVVAISGTAGVGKTALAVRWAHRVADRFPDGQLFVNLRGFAPGGLLGPAEAVRGFLDALGVPPDRIPADLHAQAALYRTLLTQKRVLIVLDNARDADHVRPLLPGNATAMVVVTSRRQLTGLVATDGAHPLTVELLSTTDATRLLTRRLGPDRIAAEPDAVQRVIDACARLPLALAVAAARADETGFPLGVIADELEQADQRLDVLDTGDPASRVRAVFSWSYKALPSSAARLFRLLGVHPGPDVSASAAASLAAIAAPRARTVLADLTRAHMVAEHSPGRYALHDLLRVYASEQAHAEESDTERSAAQHRMLDHYLHTAHAMDQALDPHRDRVVLDPCRPGVTVDAPADSARALAWFEAERPAILAALRHAVETAAHGRAWSMAWALATFFDRQGHWHDLVATQRAALQAARRLPDGSRQEAYAHRYLGRAFTRLGDYGQAERHLRGALSVYADLGDAVGQAHTHRGLSWAAEGAGRLSDALRDSERALELFRAAEHRAGQADSLNAVGWYRGLLGDHQGTLSCCGKALALLRELDDRYSQAATLDSLGYAHHHLGCFARAADCYQAAVDLLREAGDRHHEAEVLVHLGDSHLAGGAATAARTAWRAALQILLDLGHPGADDVRAKLRLLLDNTEAGVPERRPAPAGGQDIAVAEGGAVPPCGASAVINRTISARSAADGRPHSGR
ncbi:BTAD domain-containing putative transcriptional regulator [Micromonospora echinofusca]|uniref:AfsR/SARP family transcriptional regulator n=1 Tax=Micromonospora echinofusca TaxID=47858 RepID=UPI0033C994C1